MAALTNLCLVSVVFPTANSILSLCGSITSTEALNIDGFSVELIHHDSPRSPFYSSTETPFQRVSNALRRSVQRANRFKPAAVERNAAEADVMMNQGEYLMSYSVGSPPYQVFGIVDTGSDLIWLQCKPCTDCYTQIAPLFDPTKSTTYQNLPCSSTQCQSLQQSSCLSNAEPICQYSVQYGDHSFSKGDLALDILTLGSTKGNHISLPKTLIGCGHSNDGTFNDKGSGIVGLGGGSVSLVSQMGSSIGGKFSYCLVPTIFESNCSSKLSFGDNAVVSGSGTVSTLIVTKQTETYYYLTLEAVSVGNNRLESGGSYNYDISEGNIIIDSGTTLTFLPEDLYSKLESAVADEVKLERAEDPQQLLSLCYRTTMPEVMEVSVPAITAHFTGADVKLNALNTFVQVSEEVACLAFSSTQKGAILGNVAQMNFLVGYDLQKKIVSFKPTDCTKM